MWEDRSHRYPQMTQMGAEGDSEIRVPSSARRRRAGVGIGLKPGASRLPLNRVAGNACRRNFRVVSTQRAPRTQRTAEH
jgi:hypothetical protein